MERLSVAVPGALLADLRARVALDGLSFAEGARQALERGLRRDAPENESPAEEAMRLLAQDARAGKTSAVIQYARMTAAGQTAPPAGSDPDDELAAKRQRR